MHSPYTVLKPWQYGYAKVTDGTKIGLLDRAGKLVGGRMFEDARTTAFDLPPQVKTGGDWFEITQNEALVPVPSDQVPVAEPAEPTVFPYLDVYDENAEGRGQTWCPAGASLFRKVLADGTHGYGMKGPDGAILIEPTYPALTCFRDGMAWAPILDEGKWCPIGPNGQRRTRPGCTSQQYGIRLQGYSNDAPRFDEDKFTNSQLWMRTILAHCIDPTVEPPTETRKGWAYVHAWFPEMCSE